MRVAKRTEIDANATRRKCGVMGCTAQARFWCYSSGQSGKIDKSSRTPRCEKHKEE
jgi:hypothetical protein